MRARPDDTARSLRPSVAARDGAWPLRARPPGRLQARQRALRRSSRQVDVMPGAAIAATAPSLLSEVLDEGVDDHPADEEDEDAQCPEQDPSPPAPVHARDGDRRVRAQLIVLEKH